MPPSAKIALTAVFAVLVLLPAQCALGANAASAHGAAHETVDQLLARMTLEEKVAQISILGAADPGLEQAVRAGLGGTNGVLPGRDVARYTARMQALAAQSRLKIPLWFMGDVAHGFRTIYPVPLAMAATWDPALVTRVHRAAAREATASGVDWTFSPMVDISRDPRWGRVVEGAGEDPYLGAVMAVAQLHGFQGEDLAAPDAMLATAKHFAGYGAVLGGRDYNAVGIPTREFEGVYLPPFKALADAGIGSFMAAFNTLDGVPATSDRALLTGILRERWRFPGLVVSDFDAVPELQTHGVAASPADAAALALHAGIDVDLHSGTYQRELPALVRSGRVPMSALDAAVRRVLEAKARLGLLDGRTGPGRTRDNRDGPPSTAHRALAREAARRSMVLLKNTDDLLPLRVEQRIAVIGPLATARRDLLGPMPAQGQAEEAVSILQGVREATGGRGAVSYTQGVAVDGGDTSEIPAAVQAARAADVALLVLGEDVDMIGEGHSRARIDLPGHQLALAKAIVASGTPVVVVLVSGRPMTIPWLADHADAILDAWLPGTEGGHATADLLFGVDGANPSGRLPMTFPRAVGQIPIDYAHLSTGRPLDTGDQYWSHYIDVPNTPLYPFGFGLSYSAFAYGPVQLDQATLPAHGHLQVRVRVTNQGRRAGTETVQLYVHDEVASVSPPVRLLKGFTQVWLEPGQWQEVRFTLRATDLAFYRRDGTLGTEPGAFQVFVGHDASTANAARFVLAGDAPTEAGNPPPAPAAAGSARDEHQ